MAHLLPTERVNLKNYDFSKDLPENLDHKNDEYYVPYNATDENIILAVLNKYIFPNNAKINRGIIISIEYVVPTYPDITFSLFIEKTHYNKKSVYVSNYYINNIFERWYTRSSPDDLSGISDQEIVEALWSYLRGAYLVSIVLCQAGSWSGSPEGIKPIKVIYENKVIIEDKGAELTRNDNILVPVQEDNIPGGLCPICLSSSVRDGFCMVDCPKGHIYHCKCIQEFVSRNNASGYEVQCPRCKRDISQIAPVEVPENLLSPEDKDDASNEFGKRRRRRRPSVAIPDKIKKLAKKYKIKTTIKRNGKRVPKSLKLIKKQIKNKMK